jgi:hypothetical protein
VTASRRNDGNFLVHITNQASNKILRILQTVTTTG